MTSLIQRFLNFVPPTYIIPVAIRLQARLGSSFNAGKTKLWDEIASFGKLDIYLTFPLKFFLCYALHDKQAYGPPFGKQLPSPDTSAALGALLMSCL